MTPSGTLILTHLGAVRVERAARAADAAFAERVLHLKRYQQLRFEKTYADLLIHPRFAGASRFFLDDLYGPNDFTQRDAQFARIVPALVRLFPAEVVTTVATLSALHALSEQLDSEMARNIGVVPLTASAYIDAWRATGQSANRERQIHLMLEVGHALDVYTHRPLLRHSLRAMRIPARAAGMAALQSFLERGFETFRALNGAGEFLSQIGERERAVAAGLFGNPAVPDPLGQLP
jgi:hypothetical protein